MANILSNMKYKITYIILYLFFSCSTYKRDLIIGKGTKNQAIDNVIADYYHTNKKEVKKYSVFGLSDRTEDNKLVYHITISPEENFHIATKEDTIGSFPEHFPTNYKYYKDKLFVWNDAEKPLNNDVINVLNKHNILDSVYLKYELGIYDEWDPEKESPPIREFWLNDFSEAVNYVICKNNISDYKKLKTSEYIPPGSDKLPKIDCN